MKLLHRRGSFRIALACCLYSLSCFAVTATRDVVKKADKVLDKEGIYLENEYLKLGITTNQYAGQVMTMVYKPTGQDLCAEKHPQGYCKDRMGEDRFFWKPHRSEGYGGEIVSQSDEKAEAKVAYVWNYNYNKIQTRVQVTKMYTLAKDSAALQVAWSLKNIGEKEAPMTPWVKHLGGRFEKLLRGPTIMLFEDGPRDPGGDFVKPTTDWVARLSGTENSEEYPMVCSVMDFRKLLNQFPWRGKYRFTLETILTRVTLKPGESWELKYFLSAVPNLGNVLYVAPELAASIEPEGELAAGQEGKVNVHISPALALGEMRLEGEVTFLDGGLATKLPNKQVTLAPGKISTVAYAFTPPKDAAYVFSLTVYDRQKIYRLGQAVNSQRPSITLPIAVGPKPGKLVKKWEAEGVGWPRREEREVTPCRTLLKGGPLSVAQIQVPDRVFPEDRIVYSDQTAPASIRVARGEYEDMQFVVDFAKKEDVMALEMAANLLKNRKGDEIGQARLYEAMYLTTDTPSGYKNFPIGEWPDPLFECGWERKVAKSPIALRNIKAFEQSQRRVFWYIVRVPTEAEPGLYTTRIDLKLDDKRSVSFPVEVKVDSFTLPKRPSFRVCTGMVGAGKFRTNFSTLGLPAHEVARLERNTETGESWVDQIWKKCLEYGWTPTMWGGLRMWQKYHDYGRGITVFTGRSAQGEEWLKEKGLLKYAFVYAPFDEHADVLVPKVAEWCKKFKETSDVPILDCYYGSNVKPLFGLVDVWLGQSPTQEWAKERKKAGDQFFSCNSSLIWHVEFEPVKGRAGFWSDFVTGVDGRYVYSSVRWTPDVYKKNWTSGNYMGCAIYPGPSGLTTSIRWETMRDGVEDYDYLAILRSTVARAKAEGGDAKLLKEASDLLGSSDLGSRVSTTGKLHEMRGRIADLIEVLESEPRRQ